MTATLDELQVKKLLELTILPFGEANAAIMGYHNVFLRRYSETINAIDAAEVQGAPRVLELAASPYGLTALLYKFRFKNLQLASFGALGSHEVELIIEGEKVSFVQNDFNAELNRWPYDDGVFDWVICCEMIEHLAIDPMHVFVEANRVLKTKGRFLVSTPNSSSLQNIFKILSFTTPSLSPHYRLPSTMENIYQRHNRELTPVALKALFEAAGFFLVKEESVNNYPLDTCGLSVSVSDALRTLCQPMNLRGDTLNFIGEKVGPVLERYPLSDSLYLASDTANR
jgi:SAM-dependent methyltransferase